MANNINFQYKENKVGGGMKNSTLCLPTMFENKIYGFWPIITLFGNQRKPAKN